MLAPVNPAFIDYMERQARGELVQTTEEGYPLGLIPPPVDLSQVKAPKSLHGIVSFPAVYDLRPLGKLTAVRDQANCGSCWAFGAYGSLESCLLPGELTNFSENNLKNRSGFDISCCNGGNHLMTTAYLSRWDGPVYETDDPYNTANCISPTATVRKHVQNVDFPTDKTGPLDNDQIKQAVMTYGAVYSHFYWNASYYNAGNYAFYYNGANYTNHAVCIVGWDDNFDRTKFNIWPPGNGAFIVRNSWGAGWGQAGYFYISYYDTNFGTGCAVFNGIEPITNYDRIYQYDPYGWVGSVGPGPTAWFANVFTADVGEIISAVSFYVASLNSEYQIQIYLDPTSGPINPSGPVFSTSGIIANAGYQTIPISETAVHAGQKFSVVVELRTPGYYYPIPFESPYIGYSTSARANAGESYISATGDSWEDITDVFTDANCCVKAFTRDGVGMVVEPADNLVSFGPVGGPFIPGSVSYTVTNGSRSPLIWTAGKGQSWLSLSSSGGTLNSGASTTVTVSMNSQAQSLGQGTYHDTVSFVNTSTGQGNTTRSISLTIRDATLEVTPADGLFSFGEPTGPFNKTGKVYTLTNTGASVLNCTATRSHDWLNLSAPGGSLGPLESTDLTVSLDPSAEDLPIGDYSNPVTISNNTNGAGSTARNAHLTISHNYYIEPAAFNWIAPSGRILGLNESGVLPQAIPFTFYFYGQPHTVVYVGANGLLGFNSVLGEANNLDLPATAAPNDSICPYWDDLSPNQTGLVRITTVGTAPNRMVVVSWQGIPHCDPDHPFANPITFQALLCEGSNDIIFQYLEIQPGDTKYGAGRSATIGVENAQGTVGKTYSVNGSTLLTNNLAIRFTMDPGRIWKIKQLPNNAAVSIHRAIVSATMNSQFYIESDDGSCGIMVSKPIMAARREYEWT